jgi:hypothetical protein
MVCRLQEKVLLKYLLPAIVLLVFASVGIQSYCALTGHSHAVLTREFNLDEEANIPTWYSVITLFLCSLFLWVIAKGERSTASRWYPHWMGLAVIFMLLSVDELASIHEIAIYPIRHHFGLTGIFYFAWVVPALFFLLFLAIAYARWFWALPSRFRKLSALSAVVYVGGAVGMEMIGGLVESRAHARNALYIACATVEETMEMAGVLIWLCTLLAYAAARGYSLTLQFQAGSALPTHSEVPAPPRTISTAA